MASSVGPSASRESSSKVIEYRKYCITAMRLEPVATLAAAATQSQDPAMSLVFASVVELIRQVRMDDRTRQRTVEEILEASLKASTSFIKLYRPNHPVPHPQRRGWILIYSLLPSL
jgi:hypothetical protein